MEDKILQGYLYDFYGELLNDHQREIYEDFVLLDLSLGEIAEERGISRQAVHDVIRRSTKALEDYEGKLHLLEKFERIRGRVHDIHELAKRFPQDGGDMQKIESLSREILEEL